MTTETMSALVDCILSGQVPQEAVPALVFKTPELATALKAAATTGRAATGKLL